MHAYHMKIDELSIAKHKKTKETKKQQKKQTNKQECWNKVRLKRKQEIKTRNSESYQIAS